MSITVTTPEQILRSPHNSSSAKYHYSFPKAPRFSLFNRRSPYFAYINIRCDRYYELPSARAQRTTNFGYGNRGSFKGKDGYASNNNPSPGSYNLGSTFGPSSNGIMYSFGASRDAYAKVYIKKHPWHDPSFPASGAYDLKPFPGKNSKQYSMRPKTLAFSNFPGRFLDSSLKGTPGPGTYEMNSLINKDGRQVLSTLGSSRASNFNPPSSDRFKYFCIIYHNSHSRY